MRVDSASASARRAGYSAAGVWANSALMPAVTVITSSNPAPMKALRDGGEEREKE